MAWHSLSITTRPGHDVITVRCDAAECEEWEMALDPTDFVDDEITVSFLTDYEDEHNEAQR